MSVPDIVERAKGYAADLDALPGITATHDPQRAANNRPCVLVALPSLDWRTSAGGTLTGEPGESWRFVCLASKNTAAVGSVVELQKLVAAVDQVFDIATATPTKYRLGQDEIPAYVLTIIDPPA